MNNSYLDGLKADLRKKSINIARDLECQAVDSLETEPNVERLIENAKQIEDYLSDDN